MFECMNHIGRTVVGVAICTFSSSCALYAPYEGADAAKVRLKLTGPDAVSVHAFVKPITDGHCGRPIRIGTLYSPSYQSTPPTGRSSEPPVPAYRPSYPRADMADSPAPTESSVAEVRLAPGRYVVKFSASFGRWACGVEPAVELRARLQYVFSFGVGEGRCWVIATQLDPAEGRNSWRPIGIEELEAC